MASHPSITATSPPAERLPTANGPEESALRSAEVTAKTTRGVLWVSGANVARQLVQTAAGILIARNLAPQDYGIVAMAAISYGLLEMVADLGMGAALIQRKNLDETDRQTAFWMNLFISMGLMLGCVIAAPLLAAFYKQPALVDIMRVMSFGFLLGAARLIPYTMLRRELRFREQSIVEVTRVVVQSAVCLGLALSGFGFWSLVIGPMVGDIARTVHCSVLYRWRPRAHWNLRRCRSLLRFGFGITGAQIFGYTYDNIDFFIVSKFLGATPLGIYTLAFNWSHVFPNRVVNVVAPLLFPSFARLRDAGGDVGAAYLRTVELVALFIFPPIAVFAAVTGLFVTRVLGAQWTPAIVPMRCLLLISAFRCLTMLAPRVPAALGDARTPFIYTMAASLGLGTALLVGIRWGITGVVGAWLVAFPPVGLWFLGYVNRVVQRSWSDYLGRIGAGCAIAAAAGLGSAALVVVAGQLPPALRLVVAVGGGLSIQLVLLVQFRGELLNRLIRTVTHGRLRLPIRRYAREA